MTVYRTTEPGFVAPDRLLTAREVADDFRVCSKTPTRWVKAGLIESIRTPGGHHRFKESDVRALLAGGETS